MTGPWQIQGRSETPFQEMVRLDYQYVAGWSLARDVEILLATVPAVLAGRGAYSLRGLAPLVYTPHAYSFIAGHGRPRRAAYRALERLVARRTELVAAVSEDEARLAREVARARRVACIRNGIPELDGGGPPER